MLSRFLTKIKTARVVVPTREFSNLHIDKGYSIRSLLPLTVIETASNGYNPWIYQQNTNFRLPQNQNLKIDLPIKLNIILPKTEQIVHDVIEAPALDSSIKKEAVKMIVIRRKKMKKHKLKKLRKRMKFEWAKKRQKRELKKEKAFQAGLILQYKEAEAFSAEKYVEDKINKLKGATQTLTQSETSNAEITSVSKH